MQKIAEKKQTKMLKPFWLISLFASLMMLSVSSQASSWQEIKETLTQGWQSTVETFSELSESTKQAVNDQENKEGAKEMWQNVKSDSARAWDATKQGANTFYYNVIEASQDAVPETKPVKE